MAVVIPVLDEEERIAAQLAAVRALDGVGEIVVADGGSRDRTREIAAGVPGVRLVSAPRGRGPQMNAGARATSAPVLLFLHADVGLPVDAAARVAAALADPGVVGGAFRTWHVADVRDGSGWVRPFLHVADVRSRITRLPYGDQAMFVRRDAFEAVGGFPEQPLFEDVELARRLWTHGRLVTVTASVAVSGRRFLRAPLRAMVAMRLFPLLYRLGVPARLLARLYGDPR